MSSLSLSRRVAALEPPPQAARVSGGSFLHDLQWLIADGKAATASIFDSESISWLGRCCDGSATAQDLELFEAACNLPAPSPNVLARDYLHALSGFLLSI